MSLKSEDDSSIKPRALVFLLAIAGRLDAQARICAEKLDNDRYVYHAYNILDSANSSFSMFKYFFEVFISNNNDPVILRQIMSSPGGIIAISGEMLFLVGFSFLASYFDDGTKPKDNSFDIKRFIVAAWPYFRDAMKGMKNGYKLFKTLIQITTLLSGADLKFLLVPVGLALGVIAAANRLWLQSMRSGRKTMLADNEKLLAEIQGQDSLSKEMHKKMKEQIRKQTAEERTHSFLSVGLGGLLDGVYLYAGLVTLAVLPTPAFIAMVAFSAFYVAACLVSRLYDEYLEQLKLLASQTRCKLALVAKELETTYADLLVLQGKMHKDAADWAKISALKAEAIKLIDDFEVLNHKLKSQTSNSYLTVALMGVRNGLFGYGVLASLIFMATAVFSISSSVFPPALLIACICSGLAFIIGLTAYYLYAHYQQQQQNKKHEANDPMQALVALKDKIKTEVKPELISKNELKETLNKAANPAKAPKSNFQEWFEILRSFLSAISKGYNFVMFANTPFQHSDAQDHGHDSPVILMLGIASAALFSLVFAFRALARGLKPEKNKVAAPVVAQKEVSDSPKTKVARESSEPVKKISPESPPSKTSFAKRLSFFKTPPPRPKPLEKPVIIPSESDSNKVLGLI